MRTIVVADPRPGVRDRGYGSSTCWGSSAKVLEGADAALDMEGRDATVLIEWIPFPLSGGMLEVRGSSIGLPEGPCVVDLRKEIGYDDLVGEGDWVLGWVLGCQRSRTELFLPALVGRALSDGDGDDSRFALTFTMFWTKPRPCSLLMLGVRSFGGGGF
jgi:hypothetical protein